MYDFFEEVKQKIQEGLNISFVNIEDYYINIGNETWSFYSDSEWRLILDDKIVFSSGKKTSEDILSLLKDQTITGIYPLTHYMLSNLPVDLRIKITGNIEIHVFGYTLLEPWVLNLPSITYVPS